MLVASTIVCYRWRDVKLHAFPQAKHRTYVDLKVRFVPNKHICMEELGKAMISSLTTNCIISFFWLMNRINGRHWYIQQALHHTSGEEKLSRRHS